MENYEDVKKYMIKDLYDKIIKVEADLLGIEEDITTAKKILKNKYKDFMEDEDIERLEEITKYLKRVKSCGDNINKILEMTDLLKQKWDGENLKSKIKKHYEDNQDKEVFKWEDILIQGDQINTILNLTLAMMNENNIKRWEGPPGEFRREIKKFAQDEYNVDLEELSEWPTTPSLVGRRLSQADNRGIIEEKGLLFKNTKPYESKDGHKYYFALT